MAQRRKDVAEAAAEAGNTSSPDNPRQARPWTDEEMAASKPLPLPTVDFAVKVDTSGVPHAGKGETKPAGRPQD